MTDNGAIGPGTRTYLLDLVEEQRWTDEHMLTYETNYEAIHGEPAPGMAELRAHAHRPLRFDHLDE